jgi:hypothetical protein
MTLISSSKMEEIVRRLATLEEVYQKQVVPSINYESEAIKRIAEAVGELRALGLVNIHQLDDCISRFGDAVLHKAAQLQTAIISKAVSEVVDARLKKLDEAELEHRLVIGAVMLNYPGLREVMSLPDREQRLVFLRLGDQLPFAIDIINWAVKDGTGMPRLDHTLVNWLGAVKRGMLVFTQRTGGYDYALVHQVASMDNDHQEDALALISQYPVSAIASLGGWGPERVMPAA